MEFKRILELKPLLQRKSTFLLGPRSSGKTYLYEHTLKPARVYDLLERQVFKRLSSRPELLFEECEKPGELVVVDEIQKLPFLLDEVHRTIEKKNTRFLLTGSSARKLKRSQANLLGGRASSAELLPLTYAEIPDFDLMKYLNHGGIPRHYLCKPDQIEDELDDYTALYLKEEIKDEAITRNLQDFSRFLEIMALHSGDELAIENFASDCQIKPSTFRNYLSVLEDTLVGFQVPPYLASKKRKAITRSKFYLFDVGVTGFLAGRLPLKPKSELFGRSFEHWIALELRGFLKYRRQKLSLCYWRTTSQFEVDFVIGNEVAIEVKAKALVTEKDLKGLKALAEEKQIKRYIVISLDPQKRKLGPFEIYPWETFLKELWSGKVVTPPPQ
ncbi:MAG: ATP-binding protein [Proteobacteria bacterium]|nr:ATP-binding protein [Pseudomonadota bacterium]